MREKIAEQIVLEFIAIFILSLLIKIIQNIEYVELSLYYIIHYML